MFFTAGITVFREVLEAVLIIATMAAATKGMARHLRFISVGVFFGVVGAIFVALFADFLQTLASGNGQDYFNAGVAILAVGMLAWHNIWMSSHAKQLISKLKNTAAEIECGNQPLTAVTFVVALAVLREGGEIVLFFYGFWAASHDAGALLGGGILGLLAGVLTGFLFYAGFLRIQLKLLFSTLSIFILFLAAGLAVKAVQILEQIEALPPLVPQLWDTSSVLSEQSTFGGFLNMLVGYTSTPTGMEVLVYGVTLTTIAGLMFVVSWHHKRRHTIASKNKTSHMHSTFGNHKHPPSASRFGKKR